MPTVAVPVFFASAAEFRAWLQRNHARAPELLVGFHKRATGRPSLTWPESVDEALCFGWIDGVRRSLGPDSYTIRFTPRRPRSNWSLVNVGRVAELERLGRMTDAGRRAFAARSEARTGVYSFERASAFGADEARVLRADRAASAWFDAQPPSYRRAATHWATSAKRAETRARRLAELVAACAAGRPIRALAWPSAARPARVRAAPVDTSRPLVLAYAGCSTCKKALAWLAARGVAPEVRAIVEAPPTPAELRAWIPSSGKPARKWLNTSGQSYRALDKDAVAEADEATLVRWLAADGKLVKRPVAVWGDRVLVGFDEAQWTEALEAAR